MNVSATDTLVDPTQKKNVKYAQPRRVRRWVAVLVVIGVVLLIAISIRTLGQVSGQEFSPDTFRLRRFHFYEIPYLELQVSPIRRTISSPSTSTYLRKNSLLVVPGRQGAPGGQTKPETTDTPTWHLASMTRGIQGVSKQDAMLLVELLVLGQRGSVSDYWTNWSSDHPTHAAYFWPVIQRLARRELYFLIPRLFEIAQQDITAEQLRQQIETEIDNEYASLIEDARAANRMDLVEALTKEQARDRASSASHAEDDPSGKP